MVRNYIYIYIYNGQNTKILQDILQPGIVILCTILCGCLERADKIVHLHEKLNNGYSIVLSNLFCCKKQNVRDN